LSQIALIEQVKIPLAQLLFQQRIHVYSIDAFYCAVGAQRLEAGECAPTLKQLRLRKFYFHFGKADLTIG
jgi:hypothetical protein